MNKIIFCSVLLLLIPGSAILTGLSLALTFSIHSYWLLIPILFGAIAIIMASFALIHLKRQIMADVINNKGPKILAFGLIFVFMAMFSLLSNTHLLYYVSSKKEIRAEDLQLLDEELNFVADKTNGILDSEILNMSSILQSLKANLRAEITNPGNLGMGTESIKVLKSIENKIGRDIQILTYSNRQNIEDFADTQIGLVDEQFSLALEPLRSIKEEFNSIISSNEYTIAMEKTKKFIITDDDYSFLNAFFVDDIDLHIKSGFIVLRRVKALVSDMVNRLGIKNNELEEFIEKNAQSKSTINENIGDTWVGFFNGEVIKQNFLIAFFLALFVDISCYFFFIISVNRESDNPYE